MLSEGRGSLNIVVHKQILDAHLALETTNLDENLSFGKNREIINVIKSDSPSPRHRQQPHLRSFFSPNSSRTCEAAKKSCILLT